MITFFQLNEKGCLTIMLLSLHCSHTFIFKNDNLHIFILERDV